MEIAIIILIIVINVIFYMIGYYIGKNKASKKKDIERNDDYYYKAVSNPTANKKIEFFYYTTGNIPEWESNINWNNVNNLSNKNMKDVLLAQIKSAIRDEDYESAAKYRDILNNLDSKNDNSS